MNYTGLISFPLLDETTFSSTSSNCFSGFYDLPEYESSYNYEELNFLNTILKDTSYFIFDNFLDNKCLNVLNKIKLLICDNDINYENENYASNYLCELRNDQIYELFLVSIDLSHQEVVKSILLFLSELNFSNLSYYEEKFVINVLKYGNVNLQEFALNTILSWNNVTDVDELKNIKIKNKYLNLDLLNFIKDMER